MDSIETLEPVFSEGINPVASLGFIGLATDRASLMDFSDFVAPFDGVAVHPTRIPFAEVATRETLSAMAEYLAEGASVLVPGQPLGSISFSCTSGTIAIGTEVIETEIHRVRPGCPIVTPIGAAIDALRGLGGTRISLLMPYLHQTATLVTNHFEEAGFTIDRAATFDLGGDPEINLVDGDRIIEAAIDMCAPESEALFISCTGWRTHPLVQRIEDAIERPVVTSNQALAWQALRAAGVTAQCGGQGRVFSDL
jgi:maleate isomerase